jgi:hypothetical protein
MLVFSQYKRQRCVPVPGVQHSQLFPATPGGITLGSFVELFGYVQTFNQWLPSDNHLARRFEQIFVQDPLAALASHAGGPAIETRPFEKKVHQGSENLFKVF